MSSSKSSIDNVQMRPASNGVIISYTEKTKKPGTEGKTYEDCSYQYRDEVFDTDDSDEGAGAMENAWARFRELWMRQYAETKS